MRTGSEMEVEEGVMELETGENGLEGDLIDG